MLWRLIRHGFKHNTELFLAFSKCIGKIILQKAGSESEVIFETYELTKVAKDSIIFVHNYPSRGAFSPADYKVLNELEALRYISIQAHDGTMYSLSIGDGVRYKKHDVKGKLTDFFENAFKDHGRTIEAGNVINDLVSRKYG